MTSAGSARRAAPFFRAVRCAIVIGTVSGTASLGGCTTQVLPPPPPPPPPPPLMIKIPPTTQLDCDAVKCANTLWDNLTGECFVVGLPTNCQCYEGQTRSCDLNTGPPRQMCSPGGVGCGVNFCIVTGSGSTAHSGFERICHDWAGCPGYTTAAVAPATTGTSVPIPPPAPAAAPK
jgi:hypothetical protein